jgi:glutamyl-tRNA synthetase
MIKKAIVLLEGRLTNLKELPLHVFYLFEEPDLQSEEALGMVKALDPQDRGTSGLLFLPSFLPHRVMLISLLELVLSSVCKALSEVPEPWEDQDILKVLHDTRKEIKASTKVFMKTLRHALTGFKVRRRRLPSILKSCNRFC